MKQLDQLEYKLLTYCEWIGELDGLIEGRQHVGVFGGIHVSKEQIFLKEIMLV